MKILWLVATLLMLPASSRDAAAIGPDTPIRPESRVWITGASNLRRFTCNVRELSGTLQLRGTPTRTPMLSGENLAAEPSLGVSVDRIDCGIGMMNRHLQDALHAGRHPVITFRLTAYEVVLETRSPAARLSGRVSIAGVERPVAVTATVHADTLGILHVRGTYVVRPTEFGITPPKRFGGLLRVRDRVAVNFDVALGPDSAALDEICRSLVAEREP